jgi:hypothetical protein
VQQSTRCVLKTGLFNARRISSSSADVSGDVLAGKLVVQVHLDFVPRNELRLLGLPLQFVVDDVRQNLKIIIKPFEDESKACK